MSLPIANGGVPGIQQLSIEKTRMSENPIVAFAIEPRTVIDRERLDSALKRFVGEDPALRVRTDGETKQVIVAGTSERQLESVIARLTGECDVESTIGALRVIYKETFTRAADGEGKFTRQSGGRGQYAHAKIHLYPGESGGGYVFKNAMYSGSIPAKFIGPTEHGIREALAPRSIVRSGFEDLIDVMVELYDGSYHDVDSSALAFETAGGMAVEDASAKARAVLQEPSWRTSRSAEAGFSPSRPVARRVSSALVFRYRRASVMKEISDRVRANAGRARSNSTAMNPAWFSPTSTMVTACPLFGCRAFPLLNSMIHQSVFRSRMRIATERRVERRDRRTDIGKRAPRAQRQLRQRTQVGAATS
jgi:elongation factor G-like protein